MRGVKADTGNENKEELINLVDAAVNESVSFKFYSTDYSNRNSCSQNVYDFLPWRWTAVEIVYYCFKFIQEKVDKLTVNVLEWNDHS